MKRSVNGKIAFLLVFILIFSTFTGCASSSGGGSAESAEGGGEVSVTDGSYYPVTFTDMGGNEVTIEKEPQKIAALMGGTYENIVWCDPAWADKIVASMSLGSSEWRDLMAPYREDMIQAGPSVNRDPNVEELAELGVDTVFYWSDLDDIRKQMEDLGMTVIECSSSTGAPTTPEDVIKNEVDTYRMYAVALNCVEKADAYEKYVTDMVNMVADRTSSLEEGEKPSVYLMRSQLDGLEYFPWPGEYPYLAELAGATYVEHGNANGVSAEATMEQIIAWDPEYAFMCWGDSLDEITGNSQWQTVSAVKNDHLFLLPAADSNYLPTPLWLLFMAQSMHPDLYEDIDFIGEIKNYYSEFRDFDLTDEQAQYIYERRQPDGSPR